VVVFVVTAVLDELLIAFVVNVPPVVDTVLTVPEGETTIPVGFGFATVGCGINAIAPLAASVLIVAPPRSIVLPLKNKSLNLCVLVPKLYVIFADGTILPVIVSVPAIVVFDSNPVELPPTNPVCMSIQ
jgi:hypothetical protein